MLAGGRLEVMRWHCRKMHGSEEALPVGRPTERSSAYPRQEFAAAVGAVEARRATSCQLGPAAAGGHEKKVLFDGMGWESGLRLSNWTSHCAGPQLSRWTGGDGEILCRGWQGEAGFWGSSTR